MSWSCRAIKSRGRGCRIVGESDTLSQALPKGSRGGSPTHGRNDPEKQRNNSELGPASNKRSILLQETENTESKKPPTRFAAIALGWIFILGGIAGLFLPILPGIVLIFAGALMVSPQNKWLLKAREKCLERLHSLQHAFRRSCGSESWWR